MAPPTQTSSPRPRAPPAARSQVLVALSGTMYGSPSPPATVTAPMAASPYSQYEAASRYMTTNTANSRLASDCRIFTGSPVRDEDQQRSERERISSGFPVGMLRFNARGRKRPVLPE